MISVIKVARLFKDAKLPVRKNSTDAGMDFFAHGNYLIQPYSIELIGTGVTVQVPEGYMLLLKPKGRSNFLVGAGVVDAYYEPGEILVKIFNSLSSPIEVGNGDAICQGILIPILTPIMVEVSINNLKNSSGRSGSGGIKTASLNSPLEMPTDDDLDFFG
jgi:dUTP pyrophosphatase